MKPNFSLRIRFGNEDYLLYAMIYVRSDIDLQNRKKIFEEFGWEEGTHTHHFTKGEYSILLTSPNDNKRISGYFLFSLLEERWEREKDIARNAKDFSLKHPEIHSNTKDIIKVLSKE